jgi:hypothetical protein
MAGILFDTSIYIAALRQGEAAILDEDFKKIAEFRPVRWEDVSLGGTLP